MRNECLICGRNQSVVRKLFCFPANQEKLKLWSVALGVCLLKVKQRDRICDRHFSEESYTSTENTLKLSKYALPNRWINPTKKDNEIPIQIPDEVKSTKEERDDIISAKKVKVKKPIKAEVI